MPDRNRNSRPDLDRDWSRSGPDYERSWRPDDFRRSPDRSESRGDWSSSPDTGGWRLGPTGGRDYRDYREYGSDESPRQGLGALRDRDWWADRNWSSPERHGYWGLSSDARYPYGTSDRGPLRGRFFGRGPKGYRRSDERIREEISDRLMTHPDVDASDIEVQVATGIVSLTGIVDDRHEKRMAEYIAEDALGVDEVSNQLKVRHGFWASLTGEKATERDLRREAERDVTKASTQGERTKAARGASAR